MLYTFVMVITDQPISFRFQLFIGVVTNLIVFPISFIIIQLFRKSRPRKKRRSRIQEAIQKSGVKLSDINPQMGSKWSLQQPQEEFNLPDRNDPEYRDDPTPRPGTAVSTISRTESPLMGRVTNSYYNMQKKKRDKAKTKRMLPWWCQIIAWILLWLTVIVSVSFVTFYGISFGDYKCKQWITSMLIAFVMSIFVTQPIKVGFRNLKKCFKIKLCILGSLCVNWKKNLDISLFIKTFLIETQQGIFYRSCSNFSPFHSFLPKS